MCVFLLHVYIRWAGYVVRMEEASSVINTLAGQLIGKRPLGMPRHK